MCACMCGVYTTAVETQFSFHCNQFDNSSCGRFALSDLFFTLTPEHFKPSNRCFDVVIISLFFFFFLHLCTFSELGVAGFLTEYLLTECGFSKLQGRSNSTVTFFWFVSLRGCTVVSLWSQCQCGHQVFHLFNRKVLFNPILFNNIAIFNYCQKIFHMLA